MTSSVDGFFGQFGGKYVAEVLRRPLDELQAAFEHYMKDASFLEELHIIQRDYIGRETPLYFAPKATELPLSSLLFAIQRLYHDKKSFKKNSIKIFVSIDGNRNQGYVSSCRIVSICRNDSQRSFYAEKDRQHISFSAK